VGSDSPRVFQIPGFSLHTELGEMVEAGLTPGQALGAGTRARSAFFGKLDTFGKVSVGSRADLILAEGNPLESTGALAKRTGVMAAGRWYPDAELQKQLEGIAAKYAAAPAPQ
jgi:imidazolonepropionase-like amidohydrolase